MRNVEMAKQIAKSKGISFAFVCAQIGKSRSYLSEILASDRDIPEKMIAPVANALGVTVEELTGESDKKEEPDRLLPAGLDTSGMSQEDLEILRAVSRTMRSSQEGNERLRLLLKGAGIIK